MVDDIALVNKLDEEAKIEDVVDDKIFDVEAVLEVNKLLAEVIVLPDCKFVVVKLDNVKLLVVIDEKMKDVEMVEVATIVEGLVVPVVGVVFVVGEACVDVELRFWKTMGGDHGSFTMIAAAAAGFAPRLMIEIAYFSRHV